MTLIRKWTSLLLAYYYYMLAGSYRHFGNKYGLRAEHEKAIDAFTRAISHNPDFARAYMERGILYWREVDHPRRAILDLTRAYELDPGLSEARFNRGIAHQQLREYAEALADFRAYLAEGNHPHWREYAQSMIKELAEWVPAAPDGSEPS
jgi:tetratricopeptide (TPR) repeat protein